MLFSPLFRHLLLLLLARAFTHALAVRGPPRQHKSLGFLGPQGCPGAPRQAVTACSVGPQGFPVRLSESPQPPPLHAKQQPLSAETAADSSCVGSSLLRMLDWGRGSPPPSTAQELVQQLQASSSGSGAVSGLAYFTSWDPRSKALVSALELLQQQALGAQQLQAPQGHLSAEGGPRAPLPLYSLTSIAVNNSLVVARSRRALRKQRRMACNMKQLRHNERALRFMLQQQPPLQLQGLPAIQLYAHQQHEQRDTDKQQPPPLQLLEIRAVSPRALQRLGADEGALLGAWGPEGPPGGASAAGALGLWLRRLGELYEEELRRLVDERLQQAEEEYPIYKAYNP